MGRLSHIFQMSKRTSFTLLTILTVFSLFLRVHGINYYSYGDEAYHVYNSLGLASGQLPWNFHRIALFLFYSIYYAVGWMCGIFTSPTEFIGTYFSHMHVFYYAGRFFESLVGAASVPLLYLLGKKMFSRMTGLIAALFLAVSPGAVVISQIARGQALCLLLIIVSTYSAFTAIDNKRKGVLYLISGLCFGAAISIRLNAAITILPLLYFYLLAMSAKSSFSSEGFTASIWKRTLIVLKSVVFSAGLWSFLIGVLLAFAVSASPFLVRLPAYISSNLSIISIGASEQQVYLGAEVPNSLRYYLCLGFPRALGIPLYIFSSIALIIGLFRFKKLNYAALIICIVLYVIVMGRGSIAAERYLFPVFPSLFLIAGDVLVAGSELLRTSDRVRTILCLGTAVLIAAPSAKMVMEQNKQNLQKTTKDMAEDWIFSTFPPGTRIAVERMGYSGPDLKLTPVIDYWIYNLTEENLNDLLQERIKQGQPSFALRYFIQNPPAKKFYTNTISAREVIDIQKLIEEKYQYIVTCSSSKSIYEREITQKKYLEHYSARQKYYRWLEEEGELIKTFSPDEKTPGDEIRIYQIK